MYSLNERAQHLKVLPKVSNKNLIKPSNPATNLQKIQRQKYASRLYSQENPEWGKLQVKKSGFFNILWQTNHKEKKGMKRKPIN